MFLIKPIYAQITNPVLKNSTAISSDPKNYVNNIIKTGITVFIILGILYFFINFILAGYKMITSQGDPKKFEEAQHALTHSLIGLVIVLSVFALTRLLLTVFGLGSTGGSVLNFSWPSL